MISSYYTEVTFVIIFTLIIMIFIISKNSLLSTRKKRSLSNWYLLLIAAACLEWTGLFLNEKPSSTMFLHAIVKALEYSVFPFVCIQFLNVIELDKKNRWLPMLVGANAMFEIASIFTGLVFYIDENNVYQSGRFKMAYTVLCVFCSLYTMLKCFKYGKRFQSSSAKTSISLVLLMITGIALRQFNNEVRLELLCITFVAIFMYIYYVDSLQKSDSLTGLLNRGSYISKLTDISGKAAILYFDVDEFKKINDQYGHMYGDNVLSIVGESIKKVYAKYGSCYRVGGDEFCVILEDKLDGIETLNREFEEELNRIRKTEERLPTVSLGYSIFDSEKNNIEDAIYLADKDMYRTKVKLKKALRETNVRLISTVRAFQIAAEAASTLVFIYNLETQTILVDEKTAKAFGVKEKQEGIPYKMAKAGVVSEDTVDEYIRIHEAVLKGETQSEGIVKLIQADGTQFAQKLTFRAVFDDDGNPTGTAVGIYSIVS